MTEHRVDREGLLKLARSHDAVLVATGLQELRALRLGTGDAEAVVQGIDFLDDAWQGKARVDGEDVVGGGNTAMDAARSALRLGASSVRVVYRRTRVEMPAIKEEIDHALEEGIAIDFLTLPVGIKPTNGHYQLTCRRMEMGEPDESGRRRPVEIPDSDFDLACHRVILALGQSADLKIFPEGTEVKEKNQLLGLIERPVFAIGDLATWEGTVTAAIGSGRRSAEHIHELLAGEKLPADHLADLYDLDRRDHVVTPEEMKMHLFERQPEDLGETVAPAERTHSFAEVHHGIASPEEARRCLSCGVCNECDLCITYCPDGVLVRDGQKFLFDYDYCKGCGICASECPRNVVVMSQL